MLEKNVLEVFMARCLNKTSSKFKNKLEKLRVNLTNRKGYWKVKNWLNLATSQGLHTIHNVDKSILNGTLNDFLHEEYPLEKCVLKHIDMSVLGLISFYDEVLSSKSKGVFILKHPQHFCIFKVG